jgi:Htaa
MRRTLTLAATTAALLAAAPAADAATYTVTGGKLDWTLANQLTSFGDANRTFLGYITATIPGGGAGTVTPSAGATATGPTGAAVSVIDTTSPRGTDQLFTLSYPVSASGTYTDNGVGTFELKGTTTWVTHGIPLTLVDPQITLNGLTGTLRATGMTADMRGTPSSYDRSDVQFTLDLSKASVVLRADGARTITGIVPASTDKTALSGFGVNSTR